MTGTAPGTQAASGTDTKTGTDTAAPTGMTTVPLSASGSSLEECADDLNDFVATLGRYSCPVLAFAFRAHLSAILQALVVHGEWSSEHAAAFLNDMMRETLEPDARE